MRKALLFITLVFSQKFLFCDIAKIDSILKIFPLSHDSVKMRLNYELGWYYKGIDPDKSIDYFNKVIELAEKFKNAEFRARATKGLSIVNLRIGSYEKALEFCKKHLQFRLEMGDSGKIATAYSSVGDCYGAMGDLKTSKGYMLKGIGIAKRNNDEKAIALMSGNLAINYYSEGKLDTALEYFLKCLSYYEKTKDDYNYAQAISNISALYNLLGNNEKAKEYLFMAKPVIERMGDKKQLAMYYINIASVYFSQGDYKNAFTECSTALQICNEVDYKSGMGDCYNLLGAIYRTEKRYKEALEIDLKNLKIREEIGDSAAITETLYRIGIAYKFLNKYELSEKYLRKSIEISKNKEYVAQLISSYQELASTLFQNNKFKEAYEAHEIYSILKDSLFRCDMNRQFAEMQTKYETEKKEKENQLLLKETQLKTSELKKQTMLRNSFIVGFFMMIVMAVLIFRSYRIKKKSNILLSIRNVEIQQKNEEITAQRDEIESQRDEIQRQHDVVIVQKDEIEKQRDEIFEQKKEILDSIHYANRIQKAILPPEKYVSKNLPEHFILFKPRDIVSGDFYWAKVAGSSLIFCVADCTGHGVPGAFMCMLGISLLNEIATTAGSNNKPVTASGILDMLKSNVIKSLHQSESTFQTAATDVKDGMDISLCVLDLNTKKMQFAGANNPMYIVTDRNLSQYTNKPNQDESGKMNLFEIKADKMPIGVYYGVDKPFTNHLIDTVEGDIIYIFSDGYCDQFGGPAGRKFKTSRFKDMLLSITDNTIEEQKHILNYAFEQWKENYAQIDDVCVIGMKI